MSEITLAPAGVQLHAPYPPVAPFDSGRMKVGTLHELYYEQSGNPDGVPVVFLHGGPGAGSSPKHRQFFDPRHYRIVIFDQRGAGHSTPLAELRENTTADLVADIEALREKLGIKKWHVFGGSWGSTLALAYAITHPASVLSLTLRGIFLMMQREIDWFLYGVKAIYPDAWNAFAGHLPEEERKDLLSNYYKRLTHDNADIRLAAAKHWAAFETYCCMLIPRPEMVEESTEPAHSLPISRIEAHYFHNNRFTPDNFLLKNIGKIRHIPAIIVQGRYDVVCPIETAWELKQAWPEAGFVLVPDAGHSAFEPGIASALVAATNHFRTIGKE
ncbi:MAG: prolyl aminopeptidase [Micavibrio sp.]|nr:prolyl aminopeptidase [Micavibrio sp.]